MQISQSVLDNLASGSVAAAGHLKDSIERSPPLQPVVNLIWENTIRGVQKNPALGGFGIAFSSVKQDPAALGLYENIFGIYAFPSSPIIFSVIIRLGAAVVRVKEDASTTSGECLALAKDALIYAANNCDNGSRKYALEALRHFDDPEVRAFLLESASTSPAQLRAAAEESISFIYSNENLATARSDRKTILSMYPDPSSIQYSYASSLFDSIKQILVKKPANRAERIELAANILVLTSFCNAPPEIPTFPEAVRSVMQRNVENALIHAFMSHTGQLRIMADAGLEALSSERVERILERVLQRGGSSSTHLSDLLERVRGKMVIATMTEATFGPPPLPKTPPKLRIFQ